MTRTFTIAVLLAVALSPAAAAQTPPVAGRWTEAKAAAWYAKQPWLVGSNYIPASAINELEMWQADTFDPARIDRELGLAEGLGMTTMRVFLHDLVWQQDPRGFRQRIDRFLTIAAKHHIRPLFVLFDSCWDPRPALGPQHAPTPGVHNSGWVQSPGAAALMDKAQYPRLEAYVKGVVGAFAKDSRVLGWDVWNEPDNRNGGSYGAGEPPDKTALVLALLPQVFEWARAAGAEQPLTSGVWRGDWSSDDTLSPTERVQLAYSDIISFHNYDSGPEFEKRIVWLQRLHRPIICTEYMARGNGSTFQGSLPVAKQYHVGAINWGFVAGKTQTFLPWDSWQKPYVDREPAIWFHEIFRQDLTPYRQDEVDLIRSLTGVKAGAIAPPAFAQATDDPLATPTGHELSGGAGGYTYREPGDQSISIHGAKLHGEYTGTVSLDRRRHWFAQANLGATLGNVTYDGWCSPYLIAPNSMSPNGYELDFGDPSPCSETGDRDWYVEGRALAGKDLIGARWGLSPYSGLGLRYLSNGATGTAGYRTDDYLYLPVGIAARTLLQSQRTLGVTVEYDRLLHGWQHTHDSALGGGSIPATATAPAFIIDGFTDIAFSQPGGWALRASAKYQVNKSWSVKPYYVRWNVRASPVNYETVTFTVNGVTAQEQLGAYEPVNNTSEFGVSLGVGF